MFGVLIPLAPKPTPRTQASNISGRNTGNADVAPPSTAPNTVEDFRRRLSTIDHQSRYNAAPAKGHNTLQAASDTSSHDTGVSGIDLEGYNALMAELRSRDREPPTLSESSQVAVPPPPSLLPAQQQQQTRPTRQKIRVRLSCGTCNQRKQRCDRRRPMCGQCVKRAKKGAVECRYVDEARPEPGDGALPDSGNEAGPESGNESGSEHGSELQPLHGDESRPGRGNESHGGCEACRQGGRVCDGRWPMCAQCAQLDMDVCRYDPPPGRSALWQRLGRGSSADGGSSAMDIARAVFLREMAARQEDHQRLTYVKVNVDGEEQRTAREARELTVPVQFSTSTRHSPRKELEKPGGNRKRARGDNVPLELSLDKSPVPWLQRRWEDRYRKKFIRAHPQRLGPGCTLNRKLNEYGPSSSVEELTARFGQQRRIQKAIAAGQELTIKVQLGRSKPALTSGEVGDSFKGPQELRPVDQAVQRLCREIAERLRTMKPIVEPLMSD